MRMAGIGVLALCMTLVMGCDDQSEQLQNQITQLQAEATSLQESLEERDKYFEEVMHAVNEVYADLELARAKEAELVERAGGTEGRALISSAEVRQKLLTNISTIGTTLKENRKKIATLQSRIKSFGAEFASLNKLVDNLKQSLQERENTIALLEGKVQGLESTITEKTQIIQAKEEVITRQQKTMNTAYYIIGTRDELKQKGVISDEGGFLWGLLGSTTVMVSGVDQSLFTPIDRTRDETIQVEGTIKEIIPRRNQEFFAMAQPDKNRSALTIMRPERFWQDNYLVIVVD